MTIGYVDIQLKCNKILHMQIYVKTLTGRTITLNVTKQNTIYDVRKMLCQEINMPYEKDFHLHLIFAGKQLDFWNTLSDYNLTQESTIHLCLALRGGQTTDCERIKNKIGYLEKELAQKENQIQALKLKLLKQSQIKKEFHKKENQDTGICKICFDKIASYSNECGHLCVCMQCSESLNRCPICRHEGRFREIFSSRIPK